MSEPRRRTKDFFTLHVPLVLVTTLCVVATIIQYHRAQAGVERSWAYTFQWPIIGLFAIVVWNRYRKHGNLTRWFTDRYRSRVEAFRAEAEAQEQAAPAPPPDPDEVAWQEYLAELRRSEGKRGDVTGGL